MRLPSGSWTKVSERPAPSPAPAAAAAAGGYQRSQEVVPAVTGDARYDAWMAGPLNNADLAGVASYHAAVPALTELLRRCDGSFATFFESARELGRLDPAERRRRLEALAAGTTP